MTPTVKTIVFAMGICRILIGLAPFVAAGAASRLLRFPASQDSPTARLMARFFGVRDIGLGVLAFYAIAHPETALFLFLFNAVMDAGDLLSIAIPIVKREGIDRAAYGSAFFALAGGCAWVTVWGVVR
jgi:uncharacterized protein YjeT (DUF2065 family)